jgi:hypothetical protein
VDYHSRTCTVTFEHAGGKYAHTTMARSVFEAARNALAFFAKPFWKRPRPKGKNVGAPYRTHDGVRAVHVNGLP